MCSEVTSITDTIPLAMGGALPVDLREAKLRTAVHCLNVAAMALRGKQDRSRNQNGHTYYDADRTALSGIDSAIEKLNAVLDEE